MHRFAALILTGFFTALTPCTSNLQAGDVSCCEQLPRLVVTGEGKVSVQVSEASISLGIELQGDEPEHLQKRVGDISRDVVLHLKKASVLDLQPNQLQIYPIYGKDDALKPIGYRATLRIEFKVDVSQAGALLDELMQKGVSRIYSIQIQPTEQQENEARQSALKLAVQQAIEEADVVLESLHKKRVDIAKILLNQAAVAPTLYRMERSAPKSATASPAFEFEPESREIRASVTLEVEYK